MFQIRRNVFETNSSSTHSVSCTPGGKLAKSELEIDSDGFIHTELGEYGWEVEDYSRQADRLSYLVTMLAEMCGHHCWCMSQEELEREIRELNESIELKDISEEIAAYTGARGIIVDVSEGYIDHQSVEFSIMSDYLDDCGTDVLGFVFGDTVVHTDNDNHY